jgi:hypothetical protein
MLENMPERYQGNSLIHRNPLKPGKHRASPPPQIIQKADIAITTHYTERRHFNMPQLPPLADQSMLETDAVSIRTSSYIETPSTV